MRTEDEIEDLKVAVFTNILMQTAGDMTRFVRHIKAVVGTEYQEEFFEEQKELAAKVVDAIDNHILEAMPTSSEDLEIIFSKYINTTQTINSRKII